MKIEDLIKVKYTGLYGCYCHPFNSWVECVRAHKQIFTIGQKVKNRHSDKEGFIIRTVEDSKYFWIVKYGSFPKDEHLQHSANLILINQFK